MRGREVFGLVGSVLALGCTDAPVFEQGPEPVLTLLHTSDLHSRVWPFRTRISAFDAQLGLGEAGTLGEVGGFARLATLREAEPDALWLDSGDALEGAEIFHHYGGRVELQLLGELGLSAMALGNHELSLEPEALARLADGAPFPLLAANVRPAAGSPLVGRVVESALTQVAGLRVGVVGVANPQSPPGLREPDNRWQLELAADLPTAVQAAIDAITTRSDVIIALSHLGLERDQELVRGTSGLDLVLGGHQHIVTPEPEWADDCVEPKVAAERGCSPRRVPLVHSGAYGKWLSRIELKLVRDAVWGFELAELALSRTALGAQVAPSARLLAALSELELPPEPALGFAPSVVSRQAPFGADSPLGNLTADALLDATGSDVVLLNTSGLRADLEAGLVLRADLEQVFPFDEVWRRGLVPVALLRRGLERAARRSAARDCVSALQVAGLRLQVRCADCRGALASCGQVHRVTPQGDLELPEHGFIEVLLPDYVATPGADFEELAGITRPLEIDVVDTLVAHFRGGVSHGAACVAAARELSELSCTGTFGAAACPLSEAHAAALCRELPRVEGRRDDRIEMLP